MDISLFSLAVIRLSLEFVDRSGGWATGTIIRTSSQRLILVTNSHVVTGCNVFPDRPSVFGSAPSSISGSFRNLRTSEDVFFLVPRTGDDVWTYLENERVNDSRFRTSYSHLDIVAIDITSFLGTHNIDDIAAISQEFMYATNHKISHKKHRAMHISDQCFTVGFPTSESMTPNASLPIFKSATIASEPQMDQLHYFLVDTASRHGMSGGAVIHRPNLAISANGRMTGNFTQLVGIYSGSLAVPEQGDETSSRDNELLRREFGLGIVWSINTALRPLIAKLQAGDAK